MKVFSFLVVSILVLNSCSTKDVKKKSAGVINTTFDTFFGPSFPPFKSSSLLWYRDSTVIMEIATIRFESKNGGPSVRKDTIMHYLYIDLPTMSFYQYGTFTDTAILQKSYWQPDTLYIDGGWNFYGAKNSIMLDPPEDLEDTIINSIHYKRVKFTTAEKKARGSYAVGYIRCDRGRSMFSSEKLYSDSINCMMEKIESFNGKTNNKEIATGIEFIRDFLNANEIKVFDTWEQYAKKNPPTEKKLN